MSQALKRYLVVVLYKDLSKRFAVRGVEQLRVGGKGD
jgi:hypothetical protein